MPEPVTRECINMTRQQVVEVYNLNRSDIEWYKFEDELVKTND